jgi:hypothetical protein
LVLLLSICAATAPATAEKIQRGHVVVSLDARVTPLHLPRDRQAPVAIFMRGRIGTDDGSPAPRLTSLRLAVAGRGVLIARGLPVCPRARLRNAQTSDALRRCRGALVGGGQLAAEVSVPHQSPFSMRARLLAFNGRTAAGDPAIWVHAYSSNPPLAIVLPFIVHQDGGRLATSLTAEVPRFLAPLAHLTEFKLTLFRRFRHDGERRSYLNASCAIPRSLSAGFASTRASFRFAEFKAMRVEAVRSCRAR